MAKGINSGECGVDGCTLHCHARGLCRKHYKRYLKTGDPSLTLWGRDKTHRERPSCSVADCEEKHYGHGLCLLHYRRKKSNLPMDYVRHGKAQSGRLIDSHGYAMLWWFNPATGKTKTQGEHRYVMEQHLGRKLLPGENVHHINGVRDDNRIENLELWSKSQPAGQRVEDKADWAVEILKLYRPEVLREEDIS